MVHQEKTVITREYPADWKRGDEPYYPINDERNNAMFAKYQEEAAQNDKGHFSADVWLITNTTTCMWSLNVP